MENTFNWDDLRFFLALARTGTMSGAGRELGVKHTTVTRRIQALEQKMDTRLFDHTPSGYTMTQVAEHIINDVIAIEETIRRIGRQSHSDSALAGPLKLTIAVELANRVVLPSINHFSERYPRIDLQLMMTKGLVDLDRFEADLALRMTPTPPENVVGRELLKIKHGLYANPDLFEEYPENPPVILFDSELTPPDWVNHYFKNSPVTYHIDDVGSMAVVAGHGAGIAKLPCFIGDTQSALRRLDYPLAASTWGIWLLNHVDLRATARVRVCKDFLQALIEEKRALFEGRQSLYF